MSLPATFDEFVEVWACDFEYTAVAGERPIPICMVAMELRSGRTLRVWADELAAMTTPPFRIDAGALFVAYAAWAELGVFKVLGWPTPARILDLYVEFRASTNGLNPPAGNGLLGALAAHGMPSIEAAEKDDMRSLAIRGGPFTADERVALLDYCESDVAALGRLLPRMAPTIDLPRALLRGRYCPAVAHMEHTGVPIDLPLFEHFRDNWQNIRVELINETDRRYGVYEGASFREDRFATWLTTNGIPWPRLPTGRLDLKDDTFRSQARVHQAVAPLRELRASLASTRLFVDLAIGKDGRNRTAVRPFVSRTGRNQPSNAQAVFGTSRWVRSLIKPPGGRSVAYLDYGQQEFAIAAKLSGDDAMQFAYASGDPYLTFAKQAGAVPDDATKQSHKAERSLFKACALGVQYGMGADALADTIGKPPAYARELLDLHRKTYPAYWRWAEAAVDQAALTGSISTVFGWPLHLGRSTDPAGRSFNPRSVANFPCQGNGAEMLRLACSLMVERGIGLCWPIHDAVLIEAPTNRIDDEVAAARAAMQEAAGIVLEGMPVQIDADVVSWPDRFADEAGTEFFDTVNRLAGEIEPRCGRMRASPKRLKTSR